MFQCLPFRIFYFRQNQLFNPSFAFFKLNVHLVMHLFLMCGMFLLFSFTTMHMHCTVNLQTLLAFPLALCKFDFQPLTNQRHLVKEFFCESCVNFVGSRDHGHVFMPLSHPCLCHHVSFLPSQIRFL